VPLLSTLGLYKRHPRAVVVSCLSRQCTVVYKRCLMLPSSSSSSSSSSSFIRSVVLAIRLILHSCQINISQVKCDDVIIARVLCVSTLPSFHGNPTYFTGMSAYHYCHWRQMLPSLAGDTRSRFQVSTSPAWPTSKLCSSHAQTS